MSFLDRSHKPATQAMAPLLLYPEKAAAPSAPYSPIFTHAWLYSGCVRKQGKQDAKMVRDHHDCTSCFQGATNGYLHTTYRSPLGTPWKREVCRFLLYFSRSHQIPSTMWNRPPPILPAGRPEQIHHAHRLPRLRVHHGAVRFHLKGHLLERSGAVNARKRDTRTLDHGGRDAVPKPPCMEQIRYWLVFSAHLTNIS